MPGMARPIARHIEKITRLADRQKLLRSRDLARHRISRTALARMEASGGIERLGRGLYALPGASGTQHQGLVEVAKRVPKAVACLLTALRECWREKKATMDDLNRYAEVCRVRNVMRPYLESMAA